MLSQEHDIYQTNPAFKKRICLGILCFNTVNQWEIITQSSCREEINSEKVSGQSSSIQLVSPYIISPWILAFLTFSNLSYIWEDLFEVYPILNPIKNISKIGCEQTRQCVLQPVHPGWVSGLCSAAGGLAAVCLMCAASCSLLQREQWPPSSRGSTPAQSPRLRIQVAAADTLYGIIVDINYIQMWIS